MESHFLDERRVGHEDLEHTTPDEPWLRCRPEVLWNGLLPGVDESRGRLLAVVTGAGQEAAHEPADGRRSCRLGVVRHAG